MASARLPALSHALDSEFWRQRIHKEMRAGDRATAFADTFSSTSASPRLNLTPRAPVAPFAASPRLFIDRTTFNTRPTTTSNVDATLVYRATPTLLPPRSPELQRELQRGWAEPPLIMAKGFAEPPRVFRKYLEASTHSVHKPPVPVLHWKN